MAAKKNKKATNAPFSTLEPAAQKRLRQRQWVLFFQLAFLALGIGSCFFPWYSVQFGETVIAVVKGSGRSEGQLFLVACVIAAFFSSFNLMSREELDWPTLGGSVLAVGALLWFWQTNLENEEALNAVLELESIQKMIREKGTGEESGPFMKLQVAFSVSIIAAVNILLTSLYLVFVQPPTFKED